MADRSSVEESTPDGNVTVIVVSYNHAKYIDACLDSIIGQDHVSHILLCDDASTDDSAQILRKWHESGRLPTTLLLNSQNRGLTPTINAALEHVTSEYFAYISADDYMLPHRFAQQLPLFHETPNTNFIYSDAIVVDENNNVTRQSFLDWYLPDSQPNDTYEGLLEAVWIPACSAVCRTDVVRQLGGYDTDLFFEDIDMWLRLAKVGTFSHVPAPTTAFRHLSTSLGSTRFNDENNEWQVSKIKIYSKHFGYTPYYDKMLAQRMYPWLITLTLRNHEPLRLIPRLIQVGNILRDPKCFAYAAICAVHAGPLIRKIHPSSKTLAGQES